MAKSKTRKIQYNANQSKYPIYNIDVYRTSPVLLPNLNEMRAKLAKTANKHMRELEAAGLDFYAYDVAAEYLEKNKPGSARKLRFSESKGYLKGDIMALKREITVLQGFLSMESASVAGQKRIEAKRIATFGNWRPKGASADRPGLDMSGPAGTKIFYEFLNSESFKKLRKFFSSEQIFTAYKNGSIDGSKSQKKIQDAMEEYVNTAKRKSVKGLYQSVGATPIPNSAN